MQPVLGAIDATLVTAVVDTITSIAGVFTIFPLNIFIVMSIAGGAFGLLRKGKKAATR